MTTTRAASPAPVTRRGGPSTRPEVVLVVVSGAYVAAALMANVMSVRILWLGGFSIDAGTLTYPLTFTLRDIVHKVGGTAVARALIIATAGLTALMAVMLWATAALPGDPNATGSAQTEFGAVLTPVVRITVASILAQVVAELIDTEVYRGWVRRFGARAQWGRVLSSNAVSVPVDSVLFAVIAFAGDLPSSVVWSIIVANVLVKGATALASSPLIYAVKDRTAEVDGGRSRRSSDVPMAP